MAAPTAAPMAVPMAVPTATDPNESDHSMSHPPYHSTASRREVDLRVAGPRRSRRSKGLDSRFGCPARHPSRPSGPGCAIIWMP